MKTQFALSLRVIHWVMAVLVLAMLFIGAGMVSTVTEWHLTLYGWHKPIGILILVLVLVRIAVRLSTGAPELPADLKPPVKLFAKLSHLALYASMLAMPLIGWGMLSAAGTPVSLGAGFVLPPILPVSAEWFAFLRPLHRLVAYAFFLLILGHLTAGLYHGFVRRDGVLKSISLKR